MGHPTETQIMRAIQETKAIVDIQSNLLDNILMKLESMAVVVKDINDNVNDLRDDMINRS